MTDRKTWPLSVSICWTENADRDFYKSLYDAGIHHVEFGYGKADEYEEVDFLNKASSIVALMKEYDITPLTCHLPFLPKNILDPSNPDKSARNKAIEIQTSLIEKCAEVGIGIAVIHPSCEPYSLFERGDRIKFASETLNIISENAEKCGVKLAIENLPRTCLTCVHEEHNLILKQVPKAYACFDTNHSLRQPNVDFIKALGNKIITTHFSDYDMVNERHLLPFLGRNDWSGIMKALEEVDYNGPITYEVSSKDVLTTDCILLSYQKLMEA